jgi:hypothetical protein
MRKRGLVEGTLSDVTHHSGGFWCGWRDSNSHGFPRRPLKTVCLPVPPHPQFKNLTGDTNLGWIGGFEPPRLSAPPPQDGVSASSTTSAFIINNLIGSFLARQKVCQVSFIKLRPHTMLAAIASNKQGTAPDLAPTFCILIHVRSNPWSNATRRGASGSRVS